MAHEIKYAIKTEAVRWAGGAAVSGGEEGKKEESKDGSEDENMAREPHDRGRLNADNEGDRDTLVPRSSPHDVPAPRGDQEGGIVDSVVDHKAGATSASSSIPWTGNSVEFCFYSCGVAQIWEKQSLKFQRLVITLHDTEQTHITMSNGGLNSAQLETTYAIHVYGEGTMGLSVLVRAITQISGAEVLDVEFPRSTKTEIYDNRYHIVKFAQTACPPALNGASKRFIKEKTLTIHHYQTHQR
ncbi:unnamed protein product [Phytophthora fragariaefolia]|uniref:Unnamed protein product n=1 Tax=Phytophthora fragariaefolia TaxID=1490495 RepID=A0A9W6U0L4_9STRA|nr:unnamed protein product [Phytophthora fragariaefolia]